MPGHKLRHILISIIKQKNYPIDLYGSQFNNLPFSKESTPQSLTNGKILALKDYMFSVTIENGKVDYEFTEKLIDCFLSGTVPIYWGCPSIGKFFNINGLIIIHDIADFNDIIPTLTRETYDNMLPYIRENFEIAKSYSDFKNFRRSDSVIILVKIYIEIFRTGFRSFFFHNKFFISNKFVKVNIIPCHKPLSIYFFLILPRDSLNYF